MKTKTIYLFIFLAIIAVVFFIFHDGSHSETVKIYEANEKKLPKQQIARSNSLTIQNISVYLENSGSMFGYEHGENSSFRADINRFFDLINTLKRDLPKWDFYAVNSETHPLDIDLSYFTRGNNIYTSQTKVGDVSETDFQMIFRNILNKDTGENELKILISDLVYSTQTQDKNSAQEVAQSFKSLALRMFHDAPTNNQAVVIFKMLSPYNGYYYPNFDNLPNFRINQMRPYYILLVGDIHLIRQIVKNKKFDDIEYLKKELKGFVNHHVFYTPDESDTTYYTALPLSTKPPVFTIPKKSIRSQKGIDKLLFNSRYEGKEALLYIGTDFNDLNCFSTYFINPQLYEAMPSTIAIDKILPIEEIDITSIEREKAEPCTHVIKVKTPEVNKTRLNIALKSRLPEWVNETGTIHDGEENIVGTHTTFGFKEFMEGLNEVFFNGQNLFSAEILIMED